MAQLGNSTVTKISSSAAAVDPTDLVRKQESDAALAAKADSSHTHPSTQITDFSTAVPDTVHAALEDSDSIAFSYDSGGHLISASVRLKLNGGLTSDADGLSVVTGSGDNTIAAGNHTHSQLHDPLTVGASNSIEWNLVGQLLNAEVTPGEGMLVDENGVHPDFGTANDQVARGDHTHAQLHDAATIMDTTTVDLTLAGQQISAAVRLDVAPPDGVPIGVSSQGIFIPTSNSGVAPFDHVHAVATTAEDGFLSAADKRKIDQYTVLLQLDTPVLYHRPDSLPSGEYVGGRYRWNQRMQITRANVIARAGTSATRLALEINGTQTGDFIDIPGGALNSEVNNAVNLTNVFIEPGIYARWVSNSGIGSAQIENAPSKVDLAMNVQPALDAAPTIQLNTGGGAMDPFVADAYYSGGSAQSTTSTIDTSAVTSPAPSAVYQTARYKYSDSAPLVYSILGLAKNVNYTVRLHFAEIFFGFSGENIFNIQVQTNVFPSWDTIAQAGAANKAAIKEFTNIQADSNGIITVMLTPLFGSVGYNCSINAIEVL